MVDRSTGNPERRPISVIIPAYNAEDSIADCLRGLSHQTASRDQYEVIVVDDGSRDRTGIIARECGAKVVSIAHSGPAAARNHGILASSGEIVLFTDADCVPTPTWIEAMVAPLIAGNDSAKGVYLTTQKGLIPRFIQAEFDERYRRLARADRIDFVDTYSAAYRRETLDRYGMFDPRFRLPSAEDAELSFRLAAHGCRLVFAPAAQVYHRHPTSVASYLRRKYRYGVYRVQAYASTPSKLARDSYTPRTMIAEVALASLFLLAFTVGLFTRAARPIAIILFLLHLALTVPFAMVTARRDALLGFITPGLVFGRSCAQAIGCFVGVIRLIGTALRPPLGGTTNLNPR